MLNPTRALHFRKSHRLHSCYSCPHTTTSPPLPSKQPGQGRALALVKADPARPWATSAGVTPFPLSTVLPLPARGFLIVGLPLVLPIEEAFHLGRRCLLCPGWQGGSTLGWKCRFGLAVRGGRGNGTGLFGACSLLCSTVDHFICVRGFCHLGTSERPFS